MAGLAGAYGNIGYMGPGLALAVLGSKAAAPTALIFCCDSIFLFSIVPLLIALTDREHPSFLHAIGVAARQIVLNPLIMSAAAGALVAALHIQLPVAVDNTLSFLQNAAAPTALFVLGRHRGAAPVRSRALGSARRHRDQAADPSADRVRIDAAVRAVRAALGGDRGLMAALPPALNVFVIARQNDTWIEPASVAVLIGTFASVVTLTSVMWFIQSGRLVFPVEPCVPCEPVSLAHALPGRRQPLAHREPPQRAERAEQMHAGRAQRSASAGNR